MKSNGNWYDSRKRNLALKFLLLAKKIAKERGISRLAGTIATLCFGLLYYKLFKSSETFTFQGKKYKYFYHWYLLTWMGERAVEVPVVWKIINDNKGKRILELGCVLPHYFKVSHDVVDKYEKRSGVINKDIVNFSSSEKYDLIVSISTLEHIGYDESPSEPRKFLRTINHLKNLCSKEGKIVVTFPLGYNPELDECLKKGLLEFSQLYCLKRISFDNKWVEVKLKDIQDIKYDEPFVAANGLVVGVIDCNE